MKKYLFLISAVLIALVAVSCSKEYWEEKEAKKEAEAKEKADAFWGVVGQLVSANDFTDDYANQSFEPIIGDADPSDPQTRIVSTNTLDAARQRFANLIGKDVSEIGSTYTYENGEVGKLVYSEGGGNSLATVEVNIRQIPHLSRIRYATPEQLGNNGKFEGAAYYRFGDIISINNADGQKEYWICVRPAFGPEGKEKTHWVTVSPVPQKNIFNYPATKSSNKREYNFPDKLKYDMEHLKNLAEVLFAIAYPGEWHSNVTDIPKIEMFHDFNKENIRFHNEAFWTNIQYVWKRDNISDIVFGKSLQWFQDNLKTQGLWLVFGNCDWNTWFYNGPKLNQVHYTNAAGTKGANMQTYVTKNERRDVINKKDPSQDLYFNIKQDYKLNHPYLEGDDFEKFFGDPNPRWIVRYAEGCELSSTGKYGDNDVRSPIPGATDVYRYYSNVLNVTDLANSLKYPEQSEYLFNTQEKKSISREDVTPGCFIGDNGKFYKNFQDAQSDGDGAVALVVYTGNNGSVESGEMWNGLAMALEDVSKEAVYMEAGTKLSECPITTVAEASFTSVEVRNAIDGLSCFKDLHQGCGKNHVHPFTKAVLQYNKISPFMRIDNGLSDWFIPSAGQWRLALRYFGLEGDRDDQSKEYVKVSDIKAQFKALGLPENTLDLSSYTKYLSTTAQSNEKDKIVMMMVGMAPSNYNGDVLKPSAESPSGMDSGLHTRPFIAFK